MRALLLVCLLGAGCWDFDGLSSGGVFPGQDGGHPDLNGSDLVCQGTARVEDCSDGVDNDGDCAVDCADSECSNTDVCKPIAGLVAYGEFNRGAGVCRPGTGLTGPANLYDRIDPAQTGCTGCACDAPAANCATEMRLHSKGMCKANDLLMPKVALPAATPCSAVDMALRPAQSVIIDAPKLQCQVNGTAAKPNPAFNATARLCLLDGAQKGCTTASCILSQLRNLRACVAVTGNDCPAPFRTKEVWNKTYNDPRTCACSCASPDGACEGTAALAGNATCDMNPFALTLGGGCKDLPGGFMSVGLSYAVRPKAGAACTASGAAQGAATVSDPLTICCLP